MAVFSFQTIFEQWGLMLLWNAGLMFYTDVGSWKWLRSTQAQNQNLLGSVQTTAGISLV